MGENKVASLSSDGFAEVFSHVTGTGLSSRKDMFESSYSLPYCYIIDKLGHL